MVKRGLLLLALALISAACGGTIITAEPTTTTTAVPNGDVGSFELVGPESVLLGDPFSVVGAATSGGPVAVSLSSGSCRELPGGQWRGPVTGRCVFTGVQEATDAIAAAEPRTHTVNVRPRPLEQGGYRLVAPGSALVGQRFEVEAVDRVGGAVGVALDGGPCRQAADGSFSGTAAGTCRFVATQAADADYRPGPATTREVRILRATATPVGVFTFSGPTAALVGEVFELQVSAVTGGQVTVVSGTPDCTTAPAGTPTTGVTSYWFTSTAAGTCSFTATQARTTGFGSARAQVVEVEIGRMAGSFQLVVSPTVEINTPFMISEANRIGGDVTVSLQSGDCIGTGFGPYRAAAPTTCVFEGTQEENATHAAGPAQLETVQVVRPRGQFNFTVTPGTVEVGDPVTVTLTPIRGGTPILRLINGRCTQSSATGWVANAVGTCIWEVTQPDTPAFSGAAPERRQAVVTARRLTQGTFTFTVPAAADWNADFRIGLDRGVGGNVSYDIVNGDCFVSGSNDPDVWYGSDPSATCLFRATQEDAAGFITAAPQERRIRIDPLQGSFTLPPPPVLNGPNDFTITATTVEGGPIDVALTGGPCSDRPGRNTFRFDSPGDCSFTVTQQDEPGYITAQPQNYSASAS